MNARAQTDFACLDTLATAQLEVVGVRVAIGEKTLLHPTTCAFKAGQVTAILGPNGAGKSTLMSVLTGQRQPDAGQVQWQGRALQSHCTCPASGWRWPVSTDIRVDLPAPLGQRMAVTCPGLSRKAHAGQNGGRNR